MKESSCKSASKRSPPVQVNVVILDDQPAIRTALQGVLRTHLGIVTSWEGSKEGFDPSLIPQLKPHILISDLSVRGKTGLDLIKRIADTAPDLPILIFSAQHELAVAHRALNAGAWGYVMKTEPLTMLLKAVTALLAGDDFFKSTSKKHSRSPLYGEHESCRYLFFDRLTDLEFEVFFLTAQGWDLEEIADELTIASEQAQTIRQGIIQKLELDGLNALVAKAAECRRVLIN